MLKILPIPAFKDNYIWLIIHTSTDQCLIVDPGEAPPVLSSLREYRLTPVAIFLTHHHYDHVNGVAELLTHYPVPVFGPAAENIPQVTHPLSGNETLTLKEMDLEVSVLPIPGHTRAHIAYYLGNHVFCGDTLFTAGCGRLFEGTAVQMFHSLSHLKALPDETLVYCGHEYTGQNLQFAITVEPHNPDVMARISATNLKRQQNLPTVPATLALEKLTNPFLRCQEASVRAAAEAYAQISLSTPEAVFRTLRTWKDSFKINSL
ncbi:MAG TPA: hydroxyacylglutathione hydrolase [Gammaproteobacteria bacterium]|nr:hydroxyacylglutathione hydrolase [Gammaproteobacteria bacterium]